MKGINLKSLKLNLCKVSEDYNQKPAGAIRNIDKKLGSHGLELASRYFGADFNFKNHYRHLPLKALKGFTFDELCKLRLSTSIMMHDSVEEVFKKSLKFRLVSKIRNSMWRWGYGEGLWNEIVDVYDGIRNFVICDNSDFEIRLDYTTGCNEFGYSEFNRTYIDGVFAYLVYFKGKHVMTLGFSVLTDRRILLQQVQSAQRVGNRYLYKLPSNRLELMIECFQRSFPSHQLYVVDGESLVNKTMASYNRGLSDAQDNLRRSQFEHRIQHLEADRNRLVSFYNNVGKFSFGSIDFSCHGLNHRLLRLA